MFTSSKKKGAKKRSWKEEVESESDDAEFDEEALAKEYAAQEAVEVKEEAEAQAKRDAIAKIEAEKAAVAKAKQDKVDAKNALKKRKTEGSGKDARQAAQKRVFDEGIDPDAYAEKRVVVVSNVAFDTTSDDVRMLFEGYGRIAGMNFVPGRAVIEFRSDLAAEDCMPIQGSKIAGPVLHSRRLQMQLRLDPTKPLPAASRGGGRGLSKSSGYGTLDMTPPCALFFCVAGLPRRVHGTWCHTTADPTQST